MKKVLFVMALSLALIEQSMAQQKFGDPAKIAELTARWKPAALSNKNFNGTYQCVEEGYENDYYIFDGTNFVIHSFIETSEKSANYGKRIDGYLKFNVSDRSTKGYYSYEPWDIYKNRMDLKSDLDLSSGPIKYAFSDKGKTLILQFGRKYKKIN
jgi:hypothetical protein